MALSDIIQALEQLIAERLGYRRNVDAETDQLSELRRELATREVRWSIHYKPGRDPRASAKK